MPRNRPQGGSSSYLKAIVLALALGIVFYIYNRVSTHGLPSSMAEMLEGGRVSTGAYQPFDSVEQQEVVRSIAGFWVAPLSDSTVSVPFSGKDMIELKDNGIIWRVMEYRLVRAEGDTVVYRHSYDAYLRAHGWKTGKDSVAACDVRLLRQATIAGDDTCYGPTDVDVVWDVTVKGGRLGLEGRDYSAYEGELAAFFPEGAVRMIERAYRGGGPGADRASYEIEPGRQIRLVKPLDDEGSKVTLELTPCDTTRTLASFARSLSSAAASGSEGK
jgi:hypothetical protein